MYAKAIAGTYSWETASEQLSPPPTPTHPPIPPFQTTEYWLEFFSSEECKCCLTTGRHYPRRMWNLHQCSLFRTGQTNISQRIWYSFGEGATQGTCCRSKLPAMIALGPGYATKSREKCSCIKFIEIGLPEMFMSKSKPS